MVIKNNLTGKFIDGTEMSGFGDIGPQSDEGGLGDLIIRSSIVVGSRRQDE